MSIENNTEILMYQTDDGQTQIEVKMEEETVWLTQAQMAELFQTSTQNITMHIKNIYDEAELEEDSTCKEILQVQQEGNRAVKRQTKNYNLDLVMKRLKSKQNWNMRNTKNVAKIN